MVKFQHGKRSRWFRNESGTCRPPYVYKYFLISRWVNSQLIETFNSSVNGRFKFHKMLEIIPRDFGQILK